QRARRRGEGRMDVRAVITDRLERPAPAAAAKKGGNNGSDQQIRENFVASRHEIPSASARRCDAYFPRFCWSPCINTCICGLTVQQAGQPDIGIAIDVANRHQQYSSVSAAELRSCGEIASALYSEDLVRRLLPHY